MKTFGENVTSGQGARARARSHSSARLGPCLGVGQRLVGRQVRRPGRAVGRAGHAVT